MRWHLALPLLAALAGCGDSVGSFQDTLDDGKPASPPPPQQPAPPPVEQAPDEQSADAPPGEDDGPPPMERAVEPRRDDHLRVLVLLGGGYHDFAGNLTRLLAGIDARTSVTFTEMTLHSADLAHALSLRFLEAADLPAEFDAILAYTQGDLAPPEALKEKLLAFVRGGGGLVALHCAADSYPGWAGWDDLLRGRFESHPPYQDVKVSIARADHPVVLALPRDWVIKDEFYHLKDCAWDDKLVIMAGVSPAGGEPRPVTWTRDYGKGRLVYTILGHGADTHGDARYQQLVTQALHWVAGRPPPPPVATEHKPH